MSPRLAEMFRLLSGREVSSCHLEKAQGRDWQLRPDISISKLNPVEMFNLLELFASEYLSSLVSLGIQDVYYGCKRSHINLYSGYC